MNKTSSPFHCACLICPLSFLHRPILADTNPTPTPPRLTATYITLTNQRLLGFFFCLAFSADIHSSKSTVPLSGVICLADKKTVGVKRYVHSSFLDHLLFMQILFCVTWESTSFLTYCTPALLSLLYHHSLYISFFLPPPALFSSPTTLFPFIVLRS